MANRRRGEVALQWGEERYTLCLTLGALAELEDAFGVQDLSALAERFATGRLSGRDLLTILGLGLRGGGHALSDKEVASLVLCEGIEPLADAIVALLVSTFGASGSKTSGSNASGSEASELPPNPTLPQSA